MSEVTLSTIKSKFAMYLYVNSKKKRKTKCHGFIGGWEETLTDVHK